MVLERRKNAINIGIEKKAYHTLPSRENLVFLVLGQVHITMFKLSYVFRRSNQCRKLGLMMFCCSRITMMRLNWWKTLVRWWCFRWGISRDIDRKSSTSSWEETIHTHEKSEKCNTIIMPSFLGYYCLRIRNTARNTSQCPDIVPSCRNISEEATQMVRKMRDEARHQWR